MKRQEEACADAIRTRERMKEDCADAGWTRECAWENYGAGVGARGWLYLVYYLAMRERGEEIKHFHRFHGYDYSRGAAVK